MGRYNFFPITSPKKEEWQVPDLHPVPAESSKMIKDTYKFVSTAEDEEIDIMDELEEIWGIEAEQIKFSSTENHNMYGNVFTQSDFMELDELPIDEEDDEEDEEEEMQFIIKEEDEEELEEESHEMMKNTNTCESSDEKVVLHGYINASSTNYNHGMRTEFSGFWDESTTGKNVSLNLNLNYQDVLDAWSDRGSLWADDCSSHSFNNSNFMGEVPVMQEERTRREARVLRYKEKRQSRLFSKKIRYQVRKINAENRPRLKGRFVKRAPDKMR